MTPIMFFILLAVGIGIILFSLLIQREDPPCEHTPAWDDKIVSDICGHPFYKCKDCRQDYDKITGETKSIQTPSYWR